MLPGVSFGLLPPPLPILAANVPALIVAPVTCNTPPAPAPPPCLAPAEPPPATINASTCDKLAPVTNCPSDVNV